MKTAAKIIIVIAVFLAGFYFGQRQAVAPALPPEDLPSAVITPAVPEARDYITASLSVDKGAGEPASFENITIPATSTVFSFLKEMTAANDIDLQYKDYGGDLGVMVEAINGAVNDFAANRYWQYWLNGQYALVGASGQALKDGDKVEWKFTEGQMGE
ncbi:MAG: DUF4430 domain-containing protein [Planctomycetes bacterium]|jgi:hypothetical protein|nr:DUF4430 domain-containing protein [Planctomycetota bacterium]